MIDQSVFIFAFKGVKNNKGNVVIRCLLRSFMDKRLL